MRKTVSLILLYSSIFVLINGLVLYLVPPGRIAYWADWRFLGLSKTQWAHFHIVNGFLFTIVGVWHAYYNWRAILKYLRNRAKEWHFHSKENLIALGLNIFVFVGLCYGFPPMQQVLDISGYIEEYHTEKYGNPPYGHAELSTIDEFAHFLDIDVEKAYAALDAANMPVNDRSKSIKEIASSHGLTPQALYKIFSGAGVFLPSKAPEGTGNMVFTTFCKSNGIKPDELVNGLITKKIKIDLNTKMKDNAKQNGISSKELYKIIRETVN